MLGSLSHAHLWLCWEMPVVLVIHIQLLDHGWSQHKLVIEIGCACLDDQNLDGALLGQARCQCQASLSATGDDHIVAFG